MPAPNGPQTPTAATQLRDCSRWYVQAACRNCNHVAAYPVADLARMYGQQINLWRLCTRLRCSHCHQPPAAVDLLDGVETAPTPRSIRTIPLLRVGPS